MSNNNKLRELISLDEIIDSNKKLSLKQKMQMSLDEIIKHKEIYDEEYVAEIEKELDDELKEYFQHKKLNDELKEYFKKQKKKSIKNNYEFIEWDYWGVTKSTNNENDNDNENENEK